MTSESSSKDSKRVRMRDVATRAGVSISTVSLVLSGDSRIPEDTTQKVLQAVKALEYRPSVVARNLARRSSRTIGVILPEYALNRNQPFYYGALAGIHSQTQQAGYKIVVEAANPSFLERRYYHRLLKEQSADAMIYMAANLKDRFLSEMATEPYPFVCLGGLAEGVDLPVAVGDDMGGAMMAVNHLISLGHKKIGHVSGFQYHYNGQERRKGYQKAMEEKNLPVQKEWIADGEYDAHTASRAALHLLDQGVTAIFAGTDVMGYGVLKAAQDKGLQVPKDLAVVGMDDVDISAWISPPLTSVQYGISDIAAVAAKYVINKIKSPLIKPDLLKDVPKPNLIIRSSCGAKT